METEYKLCIENSRQFADLLKDPRINALRTEGFKKISMSTRYYDTTDRCLEPSHTTLRLRREDDISICCVKRPVRILGLLKQREEHQIKASSISEGRMLLAEFLPPKALENDLIVTGGVEFTRTRSVLRLSSSTCAEIAFDCGVFLNGSEFRELELELLSGELAPLTDICSYLMRKYSLKPQIYSKHERSML